MIESIRNRRTIRKYQSKEIEAELLYKFLELSCRASTMGNLQLYSIVITRDTKMREHLLPAHFNQPMITTVPVVLTFCADFNRVAKWCEERNTVHGYSNFNSFLNAAVKILINEHLRQFGAVVVREQKNTGCIISLISEKPFCRATTLFLR